MPAFVAEIGVVKKSFEQLYNSGKVKETIDTYYAPDAVHALPGHALLTKHDGNIFLPPPYFQTLLR